jgi:hypothetical protein
MGRIRRPGRICNNRRYRLSFSFLRSCISTTLELDVERKTPDSTTVIYLVDCSSLLADSDSPDIVV